MPQAIDDYSSYEVPSTSGDFYKPEAGDNRIRLASKPVEVRFHEVSKEGDKFATGKCQGEGCELCKAGKKLKYKYAYVILTRGKEPKVLIYEAPITVFRQILAYATDKEYGDPTGYDITIKKAGEKPQITYTLIASPKKEPLTKEETALLETAGIDLIKSYS